MPEPLREPEFLPDWYLTRVRRSRRCRMLIRAGAMVLLAGAGGAALAPRWAPAEDSTVMPIPAPDVAVEPTRRATAMQFPATAQVPQVPRGSRRALQALHEVLPPGVAVDHLALRNDGDVTHVSLKCAAHDAGAGAVTADALRALRLFADVRLEPGAGAPPARPATDRSTRTFHFRVRATVVAEAR